MKLKNVLPSSAMDWPALFTEKTDLDITEQDADGRMKTGTIHIGQRSFQIRDGIPRLIPSNDYADNFGLQWNLYRQTQLDSFTKLPLTQNRLWSNTKWNPADLKGKWILEAGSGAGRFTEIFLEAGARVVSFDLSSAVDANFKTNAKKGELYLFQGSIYDLPLKDNFFDYVFCYGVLQHTPEPEKAYDVLFSKAKPEGHMSIDYYLKTDKLEPWSQPKYLWRPVTTKMKPETLLKILKAYIPLWLPFDTLIKKIPRIGNKLGTLTCIPCWNYHFLPLPREAKVEWAIMDTFDALGAAYDQPKTLSEVKTMVTNNQSKVLDVFYGSNGVVANIQKLN